MRLNSLALAAGFALLTAAAPALAQAIDTPTFRTMAYASDSYEINSSQIALQRSQSPAVRRFAARIVNDHTMASARLNGGVMPVAFLTDPRRVALLGQLAAVQGPTFDRLYRQQQIQAHREAIGLFSTYARSGTDPAHRAYARATLPTLRMHLGMARRLP